MALHNNAIDPYQYDEQTSVYECGACGVRLETGGVCPDCDVPLWNVGMPQE
jgi:hypothetical protein